MIELSGGDYRVTYDPSSATVAFRGVLRLYGTDGYVTLTDLWRSHQPDTTTSLKEEPAQGGYSSIMKILADVLQQAPVQITLDLRELQFLNSSGINILSKFVIMIRDNHASKLLVLGNSKLSWQSAVLNNLKALMPDILITFE